MPTDMMTVLDQMSGWGQHKVCNDGMKLTPQECGRKPLRDRLLMTFIHCCTDHCRNTGTDPWEQRELTSSLYRTATPATLMPVTLTGAIWQLRPGAWSEWEDDCLWVCVCAHLHVCQRPQWNHLMSSLSWHTDIFQMHIQCFPQDFFETM